VVKNTQNSSNYIYTEERNIVVDAGTASLYYHVKEAGAALLLPHAALPEEEFLRMAGDLRGRPRRHVVPRDASPVALAQLLQAGKELPVLLLAPWNSWRQYSCRNISCSVSNNYSMILG